MDGVGDTAGLEEIFLSVKEAWEQEWREYRVVLVSLLEKHFNEKELNGLYFNLSIDDEEVQAAGKAEKARQLFRYLERRGQLGMLVKEARKLRAEIVWPEPPAIMGERWQRVDWCKTTQLYAAYIQRECGTMQIFGQREPVSLEGIFTDVYLRDRPSAWRRFQVEELEKAYKKGELQEQPTERQRGLEVARKNRWLFILGKPGAGKTTFLKYIALQSANGYIAGVPIFISLKKLADSGKQLFDYVVSEFDACQFPQTYSFVERLLKIGQVVILFDGLDEVNQEDEQLWRMTAAIEQFGRTYANNQFLMTCRVAATDYNFANFTYVEMADFTPAQVESFANKWFAEHESKRKVFLAELAKPESKGLRELAQTPLLLALLCLAFDETMAFPRRRVEIYEEAIDALLKKWDSSRNIRRDEIYRDLSLGRKRQMFARIAAETFEKGIYFIPQRELERLIIEYLRRIPPDRPAEEIDGEGVLKAIEAQHGVFIERAKRVYSFAHLTFQEYFTARHLVENAAQGTLDHLIREYRAEGRWREVFLLIASLLDNADSFFATWQVALETMVAAEPFIAALISWAQTMAQSKQPDASSLVTWRAGYLLFALTLVRARAHSLARTHDFAVARALDLIHALNLTLELNFDQAFTLDHARNRARDFAIELDRIHDPVVVRAHHTDRGFILQAIQGIIKLAEPFGLVELQIALERLSVPTYKSKPAEWRAFADELEQVMYKHTPWQKERPSPEQIQNMSNYLEANWLLLACLELAYVSDREEIKNRILLLPGDDMC
jgi:hypothetical protein